MICIGHRGAAGHEPENTLRSLRKALELGAPWVEIDVRASSGELLVLHDRRLARTTNGTGTIDRRPLEYIRRLDAGRGERVPFLREVLELLGPSGVGLNIELKGRRTAEPVLKLLRPELEAGRWSPERLLLSSFSRRELFDWRELDGTLRLGLLIGKPSRRALETAGMLTAWAVGCSLRHVSPEFVRAAHDSGLKVLVYTVNRPRDFALMHRIGADGVFSDFPDRCLGGEW